MIRTLIFLCIVAFSLTLPWQYALFATCIYAFWYEGIELIALGIFLDSYVGFEVSRLIVPAIYTITMSGILMFFWGLKPLLYITSEDTAS